MIIRKLDICDMLSLVFIDRKMSMYVSVVSKIALIFTNVRINGNFYQIKVFFLIYILRPIQCCKK